MCADDLESVTVRLTSRLFFVDLSALLMLPAAVVRLLVGDLHDGDVVRVHEH